MNVVIELRKGGIYFHAAFFDRELSVPCINTFIYEGYDKADGHLFRDAASYVEAQEGDEPSDGDYICFPEKEIHEILDKEHLVEWLKEEHSPRQVGRTYEYKVI